MFSLDKILHFSVLLAVTTVSTFIFSGSMLPVLLIAFAVSVSKEVYDAWLGTSGFSVEDLAADAAGTVAGVALGLSLLTLFPAQKVTYSDNHAPYCQGMNRQSETARCWTVNK